jgi:hypothetical protein
MMMMVMVMVMVMMTKHPPPNALTPEHQQDNKTLTNLLSL